MDESRRRHIGWCSKLEEKAKHWQNSTQIPDSKRQAYAGGGYGHKESCENLYTEVNSPIHFSTPMSTVKIAFIRRGGNKVSFYLKMLNKM